MATTRTHYRHCHLCEATCGIAIETEGDRIVSIRGDEEDPFSRGHVCPKATAIADVHDDPDRLRRPVVREGPRDDPGACRWREVGWDEALDRAAGAIGRVRREHGRDAVAVYLGNPSAHNLGAALFGLPFLMSLRTRNRYSAFSVDTLPRMLASYLIYGNQAVLPIPDIDRTRFLLVLGANPVVSNGSVMTAPGVAKRIRAIREAGGRVVVVDPRRTETAELADEHLFIRPGTDPLLLLAMLHVIFAEGRSDPGRLARFTTGLEDVRRLAERFPPERVAAATGIAADAIEQLARAFASAETAVCYGRIGTCNQENGSVASWLGDALMVVTGNLDRPGGAMFPRPPVDLAAGAALLGQTGSFGRFRSGVRGLPEFAGELPVAGLADEIERGDERTRPRALITIAGNPVLSTPNGARLERALARLDAIVAIDIYRNETTRLADVILPPVSPLCQDACPLVMQAVSVRHVARYAPPVFDPPAGGKADWEILLELGLRLETDRLPAGRLVRRALAWAGRRATPRRMMDALLRAGPHRLSVKKLLARPHGIDLGPLEPRLPGLLATRGKRIRIAPPVLVEAAHALEAKLDAGEIGRRDGEIVLISRRELRSNNSWMHNSRRLAKGPDRCTLEVHPDDARARGIDGGGMVSVRSRTGEVAVRARVTEGVMPGVVCLPHGYGHGRAGVALGVAREKPGASVNDLTDETRLDAVSGNAAFSGVPVTVARIVQEEVAPAAVASAVPAGDPIGSDRA